MNAAASVCDERPVQVLAPFVTWKKSDIVKRGVELGVPFEPEFVIDDYPEIVSAFGGVWVPPYFFQRSPDEEMDRVYRIVCDFVSTGTSEDRQYRAKGSTVPLF